MINQQLLDYIKQQTQQGVSREIISNNLKQQGWSEQDLNEAFSGLSNPGFSSPISSPIVMTDIHKSKSGLIVGVVVGVVVLGALSLGGWKMMQKKTVEVQLEKALEDAYGGNAEVKIGNDNKDVSIKTDAGSLNVGSSASMPAGWPSEIPQYPGSQVKMSSGAIMMNGSPQSAVSLSSNDSPEKIIEYYKSAFNKGGWSNLKDQSLGSLFAIGAEKDTHELWITVNSGGKVTINMAYRVKDKSGN